MTETETVKLTVSDVTPFLLVTSRRLSEEDPLLHTNGNHTDPQTDSGICL